MYDDNRTDGEKLAQALAGAVVLGGFASLAFLLLVGVLTILRLAF